MSEDTPENTPSVQRLPYPHASTLVRIALGYIGAFAAVPSLLMLFAATAAPATGGEAERIRTLTIVAGSGIAVSALLVAIGWSGSRRIAPRLWPVALLAASVIAGSALAVVLDKGSNRDLTLTLGVATGAMVFALWVGRAQLERSGWAAMAALGAGAVAGTVGALAGGPVGLTLGGAAAILWALGHMALGVSWLAEQEHYESPAPR